MKTALSKRKKIYIFEYENNYNAALTHKPVSSTRDFLKVILSVITRNNLFFFVGKLAFHVNLSGDQIIVVYTPISAQNL